MSDCRVPMPTYSRRDGGADGAFREVVSEFAGYGEWNVHDATGNGKYYAKLFGPHGFVIIDDCLWNGAGYVVSVRLRQPKGEAEWRDRRGLALEDGTLADAVAWACGLAGIGERRQDG